jgi:ribosomal protein S18 acetylase RimI-like enzyme
VKYEIARAVRSDAEVIDRLFIEMLNTIYHTDNAEGCEDGYLDRYFTDETEDCVFVARDGGKVIAFMSLQVYRGEDPPYVYFDDISVTAEYRGQGIGTALIKTAEEYAAQTGIPAVVFHVEKNNTQAFSLYERLGYKVFRDDGDRYLMHKDVI